MILTRAFLNARREGARKLLGSPQAMHAAILSGFPPGIDPGRPLWRVDADDPLRPALYVLSAEQPDLTHVEEQAGWPTRPTTRSASYEPVLEAVSEGSRWAFRLSANPVHRATINGQSKVVAHVTVAQQIRWLTERQDAMGVDLGTEEDPTFTLIRREVRKFRRDGGTVTLAVASFEGALRVKDPDRLREALTVGVGRAKAYGCGLMTLAPA